MKEASPVRLAVRLALALALASSAGCLSDRGERCYLDSDCSDNLVCCKATSVVTEDGSCQPEGTVCGVDAGVDAGPDSGAP